MTPTTLALQMPFQSKEESISSLEWARSAWVARFAGRRPWRTGQLMRP
jgi:hypothetical protein